MLKRFGMVLALWVLAAPARAQEAPEQLLPAGAQLYVRWDGLKAHRAAYEKTAVGKMMQGDTGKFFSDSFGLISESISSALTVQGLLAGTKPDELQKLQADAGEAGKLLAALSDHGFLFAVEGRSVLPPSAQATLILPGAGDRPAPLFGTFRLITGLAKVPVKEVKADGRVYHVVDAGPVQFGWWVEGPNAVAIASTDPIEAAAKRMRDGKGGRLTESGLYKKVRGFKEFETAARGFLDFAAVAKLAAGAHKDAAPLIKGLGLDGLQSIAFYSGFEGETERSLTEVDLSGGRKGLLSVMAGKPFTIKDVPPLPADTISWSMTRFDTSAYYDALLQAAETVVKVVAPDELGKLKEFIQQADKIAGVDIRKDLIGSLGDQLVYYSSPTEGVFTLSQTVMLKVKDQKKLDATLEKMIKALGEQGGVEVTIKKRQYRGVELREVYVNEKGFVFVPTYAFHKDWIVIGYFPQTVQGYVLRAQGELESWKPDESVGRSLNQLPKEFLSVSVSDPRPTVKQVLTLAPLVGGAVRSFFPESKFDVGSIPHAQEATRHLFPNVSVVSDDGKVLRIHTRASLALPFDLGGQLDTAFLAFAAVGFFSAIGDR